MSMSTATSIQFPWSFWAKDASSPTGLAVINAEVTRQAALVAYVNDFWIMMAITVLVIPLLVLIRKPRGAAAAAAADVPH